jgi:hypothetical protein
LSTAKVQNGAPAGENGAPFLIIDDRGEGRSVAAEEPVEDAAGLLNGG